MKRLLCLLLCLTSLYGDPAIVFVHLGQKMPDYLPAAVRQARLFNPTAPIYVVASQVAFLISRNALKGTSAIQVDVESLSLTEAHRTFLSNSKRSRRTGLWLYSTERFFYLLELMKKESLTDVIHLESDNMLYVDIGELLPTLQAHYSGMIGATFDNDGRAIAGLVYISDPEALEPFANFVASESSSSLNDMEFLSKFRHKYRQRFIDHLPIAMSEYAIDNPLISPHNHQVEHPELYVQYSDEFGSFFDAAAIGQFLGGNDPIHPGAKPGFVNESCVVNPTLFTYEWIRDDEGRKIPYAIYNGQKWRLNNLHIHCKNLNAFSSK